MQSIDLDNIPHVWRGIVRDPRARGAIIPSGFSALDDALGGGWPAGELIELLVDQEGIGELQLLLPLARALMDERPEYVILWVNVAYDLNAVALLQHGIEPSRQWFAGPLRDRDSVYCIETGVRSQACALVLAWLPTASTSQLRRIKLGCVATRTMCVLFRPQSARSSASPAGLRASLVNHEARLQIDVFKQRARAPCVMDLALARGPDRASVP